MSTWRMTLCIFLLILAWVYVIYDYDWIVICLIWFDMVFHMFLRERCAFDLGDTQEVTPLNEVLLTLLRFSIHIWHLFHLLSPFFSFCFSFFVLMEPSDTVDLVVWKELPWVLNWRIWFVSMTIWGTMRILLGFAFPALSHASGEEINPSTEYSRCCLDYMYLNLVFLDILPFYQCILTGKVSERVTDKTYFVLTMFLSHHELMKIMHASCMMTLST